MLLDYIEFATYHRRQNISGETFAFRVENDYSLENFHISMLILPINKARICGKRFAIE